jgi:hypothetical protein
MLTDYALGLLTLFWAGRLFWLNRQDAQISRLLWAVGFIATAIASFLGGSFHGFKMYLSAPAAALLWKCSVYSIGITSWAMFSAVLVATFQRRWHRWLLALVAVKFAMFAAWMSNHSEFRYVIFDYGSAMVGILIAQAHGWFVRRDQGAPWIITGIIVGLIAALIQMSRYAIHPQFNHNDLFHVIQATGFYLFYRGGQKLRDCSPDQPLFSVKAAEGLGDSGKPNRDKQRAPSEKR